MRSLRTTGGDEQYHDECDLDLTDLDMTGIDLTESEESGNKRHEFKPNGSFGEC